MKNLKKYVISFLLVALGLTVPGIFATILYVVGASIGFILVVFTGLTWVFGFLFGRFTKLIGEE